MKQTKTKIEQKMRIKLNLKYIIQINNKKINNKQYDDDECKRKQKSLLAYII